MQSTTIIRKPEINLPKLNLSLETEIVHIVKLVDPKAHLTSQKSPHNKTMNHTTFKKSPNLTKNINPKVTEFKIAPLFRSKLGKYGSENDDSQLKLSKYLQKSSNISISHNQSATLKHSRGVANPSLNNSAKINYNRGRHGTTEGSRSDVSGTVLRQQKSLKPRAVSPTIKNDRTFNSTYNLTKQTSPASYSKKPLKKPFEAKKTPTVKRNDNRTRKAFNLEYLKDEKISKLSESQLGNDFEETRKLNSTSKIFMSPKNIAGKASVALNSPSSKLQHARMAQNLMNNVGCR